MVVLRFKNVKYLKRCLPHDKLPFLNSAALLREDGRSQSPLFVSFLMEGMKYGLQNAPKTIEGEAFTSLG